MTLKTHWLGRIFSSHGGETLENKSLPVYGIMEWFILEVNG